MSIQKVCARVFAGLTHFHMTSKLMWKRKGFNGHTVIEPRFNFLHTVYWFVYQRVVAGVANWDKNRKERLS